MEAPHVTLTIWWLAAITGTLIFLLYFMPIMPNRQQQRNICLAPAAGAAALVLYAVFRHESIQTLLPMYTAIVVAFPLGLIGHRRDMKEKLRDREVNGPSRENEPSIGSTIQVLVALFACGSAALLYVNL
ncbi:hypothetical protein [Streptomyces sp. NPDC048111]|uniref:hypothetical protein n=1 Tax=Streptomyces sp. NPDC048111 TaxID=3365500 RepID=UPI003719E08D